MTFDNVLFQGVPVSKSGNYFNLKEPLALELICDEINDRIIALQYSFATWERQDNQK